MCVYASISIWLQKTINLAMFLLPYSYTEAHSIRLTLFKPTMAHLHFILLSHLDFGLIGSFFGTKYFCPWSRVLLEKLTVGHKRNPHILWNQYVPYCVHKSPWPNPVHPQPCTHPISVL